MKKKETKVLQAYVPASFKKVVETVAHQKDISVSELIAIATQQFIDQYNHELKSQ